MALPSGYKRLEYIRSSGTQYIDTGFTPDSNSGVNMVCEMLSKSGNQAPFMTRDAPNGTYMFGIFSISGVFRSDYGSEKKSFSSSLSTLQKLSLDRNKNVCTIGTTTITNTASTFTAKWTLFLLASDDNGTAKFFSNAKLYSCQIYDNGTLVRDYIPCQKPDGTIGLWDDVNSVFYGNAGTGTFTAGPVVAHIPEAPSNLQQTMAVRLAWAAVSSAERYNVYRGGTLLATTTDLAYVDDTVAENQEYTYGVSAVNSAGESPKTTISVYTKTGYFLYKPVIESATFQ